MNSKTSFVTNGTQDQKTGWITALNTTLNPTMKPIASPIWASGIRSTLSLNDHIPILPTTWPSGFQSRVFPFFSFLSFYYSPTSSMLPQRCVDHLTSSKSNFTLSNLTPGSQSNLTQSNLPPRVGVYSHPNHGLNIPQSDSQKHQHIYYL